MRVLLFFIPFIFFISNNSFAKSYTVIQRTIVNKDFTKEEKLHFVKALLKQKINKDEINFKDKHGYTALDLAVIHNLVDVVEVLLKNGANPNIKDKNGYTPLHRAVIKSSAVLTKLLLKYGADPNVKDIYGYTPLQRAVIQQSPELVKILLENGADPNIKDSHDYYPLERALMFEDVDTAYEISKLLLDHKANPMISDKRGVVIFEKLASEKGNRKKLLNLLVEYIKQP